MSKKKRLNIKNQNCYNCSSIVFKRRNVLIYKPNLCYFEYMPMCGLKIINYTNFQFSNVNLCNFFTDGTSGKDHAGQCRRCEGLGLNPWVRKTPEKGHDNQLQYSCLDNPHGQRSLAGLQSMGSQTVGHNQSDLQCIHCEMK